MQISVFWLKFLRNLSFVSYSNIVSTLLAECTKDISNWEPIGSDISIQYEKKTLFYISSSESALECRKRAKNIRNRKLTIFYIEAIPKNIFQIRKIIFLRAEQKEFLKLLVGCSILVRVSLQVIIRKPLLKSSIRSIISKTVFALPVEILFFGAGKYFWVQLRCTKL